MQSFSNILDAKKNKDWQLKETFLANISHEIRTPMNIIVGFSNLLSDSSYNDDQKKFFIEEINKNSLELLRIIDQLIITSEIQTKSIDIHHTECRVNQLFESLFSYFTYSMHKHRINQISLKLEQNDTHSKKSTFVTDPDKLKQALICLIENAIKYTNNGTVTFGYTMNSKGIEMFVKDTGVGIEGRNLKNIFKKFYRGDNHPSKTNFGLGIGLSIANDLIHLLGGELNVKTKPGEGSLFYFTIPFNSKDSTSCLH
ncbi:MAG: HAMP domain-containing histidine kinase [Bacteroidetes bacterium]|nr:HAMP domain-containing histidine kinase [Bacteroidota bacterium]